MSSAQDYYDQLVAAVKEILQDPQVDAWIVLQDYSLLRDGALITVEEWEDLHPYGDI